jgi:hypothetical protein
MASWKDVAGLMRRLRQTHWRDKKRTETAEDTDEQALLALVAAKQKHIPGRGGALFQTI